MCHIEANGPKRPSAVRAAEGCWLAGSGVGRRVAHKVRQSDGSHTAKMLTEERKKQLHLGQSVQSKNHIEHSLSACALQLFGLVLLSLSACLSCGASRRKTLI